MAALRPARDAELIQIVDIALADATARGGHWLACGRGCTQCCHGVFPISALDAMRLRDGLAALAVSDEDRATRVHARAKASAAALIPSFPGDPATGILGTSEEDEQRFADFANDAPCPVLDPETGTCDLYSARPLTCRIFGPPVLSEQGLGMCELCFQVASQAEIEAGQMHLLHAPIEAELTAAAEQATQPGETLITFALLHNGAWQPKVT